MEQLLRAWDGEEVIIRRDHPTGAWIVVAIHSRVLGPATGGTRLKRYPDLQAALADALRLSEGMTYKFAVTGFPRGGGKAVIAVPGDLDREEREGLLRRYGALVRDLGGLFLTGPDVGTSSEDMDVIAQTGAPYIHSRTVAAGGAGDSGPATALGVFRGMETLCERLFGARSMAGRRVLVQGAGSVGRRLIRHLRHAGADVLFCDVEESTVRSVVTETGARAVATDEVYGTPCDILSPCALGGVLNAETIPRLRCRAVAGSANNQLATPEDAGRLRDLGILYAPDFVLSMGGAMAITGMEAFGWTREEADEQVAEAITSTLRQILDVAEREEITTVAAARRIADERLGQSQRHGLGHRRG